MTIQNTQHAYYTALVLSLTTEDDNYRDECISIAAGLSEKLTEDQQQECKDKIIAILQKGDFYTDEECVEKVNSIHGTSTIATGGFLNADH